MCLPKLSRAYNFLTMEKFDPVLSNKQLSALGLPPLEEIPHTDKTLEELNALGECPENATYCSATSGGTILKCVGGRWHNTGVRCGQ
jgi:hypothetical protein